MNLKMIATSGVLGGATFTSTSQRKSQELPRSVAMATGFATKVSFLQGSNHTVFSDGVVSLGRCFDVDI